MTERRASHLRLVPAVNVDDAASQPHSDRHPSAQPALAIADEFVFEWHGLVQHEPGETPCCHQRIEVTNLVDDHHAIAHDIVAMLSTVLHGWDGYDVTVLMSITPPQQG
jgi:hypothetical protein